MLLYYFVVNKNMVKSDLWIKDQLVLALEFCIKHVNYINSKGGTTFGRNQKTPEAKRIWREYQELKKLINQISEENGLSIKNTNSISMHIRTFQGYENSLKGKKGGLKHFKGAIEVWEEYNNYGKIYLNNNSILIKNYYNYKQKKKVNAKTKSNKVYDKVGVLEGTVVERLVKERERDPKVKEMKEADFIKKHSKLYCENCKVILEMKYVWLKDCECKQCINKEPHGARGYEVHHELPLFVISKPRRTLLKDVLLLCPNCHSMVHRSKQHYLTKKQLKQITV